LNGLQNRLAVSSASDAVQHQSLGPGIYWTRTWDSLIYAQGQDVQLVIAARVKRTKQEKDIPEGTALREVFGNRKTYSVLEQLGFDEESCEDQSETIFGKTMYCPTSFPTFNPQGEIPWNDIPESSTTYSKRRTSQLKCLTDDQFEEHAVLSVISTL
jgi:hypothetical protein